MSLPEVPLWTALKGRGPSFRRQIPFDDITVDFYCPAARPAIEIDGAQHELTRASDDTRDEFLHASGILVRRISAKDVVDDPNAIAEYCLGLASEIIDSREEPNSSNILPPPPGEVVARADGGGTWRFLTLGIALSEDLLQTPSVPAGHLPPRTGGGS